MQALDLIKHLYHQDPKVRYKSVLILGMVEETTAISALQQRMNEEPEQHIKKAIQWAGQRIQTATQNEHSTVNAIFDHFQINRELASNILPEEAKIMRKMQQQLDSQLMKMEQNSNNQRGKMALGAALGGAMMGGVGVGASQASSILNSSSMRMRDGSSSEQPALRIPPTQLGDNDISQHVKRLIQESDTERQRKAALALGDINNPTALPYLALTIYQHPDTDVVAAAETSGKRIYWNYNYLMMEQDGRLEQEIEKRRADMQAGAPSTQKPQKPIAGQTAKEDIGSILDRAQKKRKRRKN